MNLQTARKSVHEYEAGPVRSNQLHAHAQSCHFQSQTVLIPKGSWGTQWRTWESYFNKPDLVLSPERSSKMSDLICLMKQWPSTIGSRIQCLLWICLHAECVLHVSSWTPSWVARQGLWKAHHRFHENGEKHCSISPLLCLIMHQAWLNRLSCIHNGVYFMKASPSNFSQIGHQIRDQLTILTWSLLSQFQISRCEPCPHTIQVCTNVAFCDFEEVLSVVFAGMSLS